MELKEYKDFKRPKFNLPQDNIIRCMSIDMTVTSRTIVNEQSKIWFYLRITPTDPHY